MTNFFNTQTNFRTRRNIQDNQNSIINARNLYQDVVRKNQEIIKQILAKINDLYSRQEEFDSTIKLINEKLIKMNEASDELHHQFRANHIEIQRKHQGILNDLNGVKGILKLPDPTQTHQQYLQSDFFKEQAALVNIRTRTGRRAHLKTNLLSENMEKQNKHQKKISNFSSCEDKSKPFSQNNLVSKKQVQIEDYFKQNSKAQVSNCAEVQAKICKQFDNIEDLIQFKMQAIQQKLQASINNSKEQIKLKNTELTQNVKNLQSQLQAKMEKISLKVRRQHDWGQINFEELHSYLQSKIKEELHQKISKKYFQESLNNLKQSWQEELDQTYSVINSKLNQDDLIGIQQKINEMKSQIELVSNLNSIKIQNISYNSTCKSTPQRFSPSERSSSSQMIDNIRNTRESDQKKIHKRNEFSLSSSYASIFKVKKSTDDKKTTANGDQQSMFKWKGKVMQTLGLVNKKVRRVKRSD